MLKRARNPLIPGVFTRVKTTRADLRVPILMKVGSSGSIYAG
jgi:hypothetical protein